MKSIYVYDKRKYFIIYLKKRLSKRYNFIKLTSIELMNKEYLKNGSIGLFVANDVNDIVAFFRYRECFNDKVLVCTEKILISDIFKKTFKINSLDISKPKKHFYDDLNGCIDDLFYY